MLRLVLEAMKHLKVSDHPLRFLSTSTWYSEARLLSPFRPRWKGDPLGEGFTNADGVIGDFQFRSGTKAGLELSPEAKQFVVVEAKMMSGLSTKTGNASGYDQAARNVACMAEVLKEWDVAVPEDRKRKARRPELVGFFVIAPEEEIRRRGGRASNLEELTKASSIRRAVERRIGSYESEAPRETSEDLKQWYEGWFEPLMDQLEDKSNLRVLSWEEALETIWKHDGKVGSELSAFYQKALRLAGGRMVTGEPAEAKDGQE